MAKSKEIPSADVPRERPYRVDPRTGEILSAKNAPLNEFGQELPDPTPMAPPVGFKRQKPLHELIREMVRSEHLAQAAAAAGAETFEESDDFDVDDDSYDPSTPYEMTFEGDVELPSESQGAPAQQGKPAPAEKSESGSSAPEEPPAKQ